MTFQEYCTSKKIDAITFQKEKAELYSELEVIFNQVSPASFTQQKKFLINTIRRSFKLETKIQEKKPTVAKKPAIKIPGIKPKPAVSDGSSKPKIPGAKPVIKPKVAGASKPVIKPKIPTSTAATQKPKIPSVPKPVIKPITSQEEKPKPTAIKPKIPGISKPSSLKPKIPKK